MAGLRERWKRLTDGDVVVTPAVTVAVVVAVTSYLVGRHRGAVDVDVAMGSMVAFLFGVLVAFAIARMRDRLALVQGVVAVGNAAVFSIHELAEVFGEPTASRIEGLVDQHLTAQIDYRLVDYHLSESSALALIRAVRALTPDTSQERVAYRTMVELTVRMDENRLLIEAATGQAMSSLEWASLLLLLIVLLGLCSVLPGGTILGALAMGALAAALVMLIVLIRKLDVLRWHERVTIWGPTSRLFRSMGLDPYVPRHVIDQGRFRPVGQARVVTYLDPYPNRSRRVISLEVRDESGAVIKTTPPNTESLVE